MAKPEQQHVFLNIPYDEQFERTYLAYVTALSAMGFPPQATLGIGGSRRLDRISSKAARIRFMTLPASNSIARPRAAPF